MTEGWKCPVCEKGNAPHADKCGHCSESAKMFARCHACEHVMPATDWLRHMEIMHPG